MNDEIETDEGPEPIEVPLGDSGLFTWIDEEDRDLLVNNWTLKKAGSKKFPHYYAINKGQIGKVWFEDYLHNEVWERMMDAPLPKGFLVDHINGDKLDNRRSNLRLATRSENEANKKKRRTHAGGQPSSQYKGVSKIQNRKRCWRAAITYERRQIPLGTYCSEADAARAYNKAAVEYYSEFAYLNEIHEEE